jgi:hypothetical protein
MTEKNSLRKVPMQVLSIGMGRTGTASMAEALKLLGYHTYHGLELFDHPEQFVQWEKAADGKWGNGKKWGREEWDAFLSDWGAMTDLGSLFWDDLVEVYPEVRCFPFFPFFFWDLVQ